MRVVVRLRMIRSTLVVKNNAQCEANSDRPMVELADGRWPMAMLTTGDADGDADGDVSCHFRFNTNTNSILAYKYE